MIPIPITASPVPPRRAECGVGRQWGRRNGSPHCNNRITGVQNAGHLRASLGGNIRVRRDRFVSVFKTTLAAVELDDRFLLIRS